MILFPAIDILDGNCVRLLHGDFNKVTVYGEPLQMAKKWQSQGAGYLHIVDLNGALNGTQGNLEVIKSIISAVNIPVQVGGGIRTLADIKARLDCDITRVILGTVCCKDPSIVKAAIELYGNEKIVCGIDACNGFVQVDGWVKESSITPIELGLKMKSIGVKYVVFTDISRDGALSGVNVDACSELENETGLKVIASGGVSCLDDLVKLKSKNMYGAILGKALYANKFSVSDAVKMNKGNI